MRLFNSKKKKLAAATIAAVGIIGAGAVAANAAGDTGCKYLTYPLCARSVASLQVVDGSLSESDLSATVRTKLNKVGSGAAGPAGPAGPTGAAGADGKDGAAGADGKDGAAGKDGVSGLSVGGATTVVPKGFSTLKLDCADGKKAIGGGLKWDSGTGSTASETVLNGSYPTDLTEVDGVSTATSWTIALTNNSPKGEVTVQPFVTCVTAS